MPEDDLTPTEQPAPPTAADKDLQREAVRFGMILVGAIVGTALWLPREYSQRAFRLIDVFKRDPKLAPEYDDGDEDDLPSIER
ncbi:hypothetical protein D0Z67_29510 (plasmid) [Streptomyces seoulensis]|uniref:Uncharacterized protein n=1 Tax=Streptomyces seoulensis TaxID=73044 RepID=A0A4P6U853_STRSO|nr:hypothetical protein [Streptomyces seoulensis]QBJ94508.1 hypothetical protein D0Z67_29510 [Streptomyces seoulensis]